MSSRWLRLLRIHTASLTQGIVLLGLTQAGVEKWWLWLFFALFAVSFHATGFLHNNICDYEDDKKDPAKKHFPLISGEISLNQAKQLYYSLLLCTFLLGIWLSRGRVLSILFLSAAIGFGHLYNFRSKRDLASPLYITATYISLPLFSYFAYADGVSFLMGLMVLYLTFLLLYQIGVEGYMKDIKSDRVSLLKRMGTQYAEDGLVRVSNRTKIFAWSLKIPAFLLFGLIWFISKADEICLVLGLFLIIGTVWSSFKLLESGYFDNIKRVRLCAIIEVLSYTLLVIALQGLLGWYKLAFFILYPYGWFILFNQLTWKTIITPRV